MGNVVDEIPPAEAPRLMSEPVKPLAAEPLYPSRCAPGIACGKVDACADPHAPTSGHDNSDPLYQPILLGKAKPDVHDVRLSVLNAVKHAVDQMVFAVETILRAVPARDAKTRAPPFDPLGGPPGTARLPPEQIDGAAALPCLSREGPNQV